MSVDLIVWAIIVLTGTGIGWWLFRQGGKDNQIDTMQQVNSDALLATKIQEQAEAMSSDGVRAALHARVRKPG